MKNTSNYLGLISVVLLLISYGCQKETIEISIVDTIEKNPSTDSIDSLSELGMQLPDFAGEARKYGISFSIGHEIYLGMGFNESGLLNDFWEWNYDIGYTDWDVAMNNSWTKLPDFPGFVSKIGLAVGTPLGFAVNGKGYILPNAGKSGGNLSNEFWEFDPQTNAWARKADAPPTLSRYYATGFTIGTKLYIGTGESYEGQWKLYNDFWEWDQTTDKWTKKADFPGLARAHAAGFSIGDKGYLGLGGEVGMGGGPVYKDFWEYDPATDEWNRKADFRGNQLIGAIGFSIGNSGYVTAGMDIFSESAVTQEIWEWNQATNSWTKTGIFSGIPRTGTVGGTIANRGYLLSGDNLSSGFITNRSLKDFWLFDLNSH